MKKLIIAVALLVVGLAMSLPAVAIVLSPDATNVPSGYATISDGKVSYNKTSTAWDSVGFNAILGAYGLQMSPDAVAGVPTSYAKVDGDKVVFNKKSIAYQPADYHKILTAYGLILTPEEAGKLMGAVDFCKVVDGKIVFSKAPTAYSGVGWSKILGAYSLPVVAVVETDCIDSDGDLICDEIDVCGATPKGVKVDERGCWVVEQTYLFDFDKAEIKPAFLPLLARIAQVLQDNPKVSLQIEGNTDSVGTAEYNQGLSERRANAIKNALIAENGADANRLKAVGLGEENPITTNETAEGRAQNRRVELKPTW